MSGLFFEYPGVRFSRQIRLWKSIMRAFAFLLVGLLTQAVRHSFRFLSRPQPAEFSAATHIASQRPESARKGSRAADRASFDALRLNNNSVNTEDLYGISIIREKLAAPTRRRRLPTQRGRRSFLSPEERAESAGKEIVLGQSRGIFWRRKPADRTRSTTATQQQRWKLQQHEQQRLSQWRGLKVVSTAA